MGQKGGKASGIARNRRKTFRLVFNALLTEKVPSEVTEEKIGRLKAGEVTVEEAIALAQVYKAIVLLDTSAAAFIRDTLGEKPNDKKDEQKHVSSPGIEVVVNTVG